MVSLAVAQAASYSLFLDAQKLYRFVSYNHDFKVAFNSANEEQKDLLNNYIINGDRVGLLNLVNFILKENSVLETYSIKDLRKLAQSYCVENWNFLTKDLLLKRI